MDLEFYMQKTFCKTASLMANSAKSIAVLSGQPRMVRAAGGRDGGRAANVLHKRGHQQCLFASFASQQPRRVTAQVGKRAAGKASMFGGGLASY